jgi:hypothetical protein
MSKNGYFATIPVRFFVVDYEGEEVDLKEVNEHEFLQAEGRITYERHTVRENGCSQICLTKKLDV